MNLSRIAHTALMGLIVHSATAAVADRPSPRSEYFRPPIANASQVDTGPNDRIDLLQSDSAKAKHAGDSLNMTRIGAWAHGLCSAVGASGNFAYYGDGSYLQIVDVSNQHAPVLRGKVLLPEPGLGINVVDSYVYVADGESGTRIVDVTNPDAAIEVGYCGTGDQTYDVSVSGNYAYVADGTAGLVIFDVRIPNAPIAVGHCDIGAYSSATLVQVIGTYAYVINWGSGLHVVDVSNPEAPIDVGYFHYVYTEDMYVSDGFAYLVSYGHLLIINVSNPSRPSEAGSYTFDDGGAAGNGVAVVGGYAFIAGRLFHVINVTDPGVPVQVGYAMVGGPEVSLCAGYAYVACYDWGIIGVKPEPGLRIIDVNNANAPVDVGHFNTAGRASDVSLGGNYAYLAESNAGVVVIDVSVPEEPVEVGYVEANGANCVVAGDRFVFIGAYDGLRVVDVSKPDLPIVVGNCSTGGSVMGVFVAGSYAYVACYDNQLRIISIDNPRAPIEVGHVDLSSNCYDVTVAGDYAYVANYSAGLSVINVSNPTAPIEVGRLDTGGYALAICLGGTYAYIADRHAGLRIIDVSNVAGLHEVGHWATGGGAGDVTLNGKYAYVVDGENGLRVIDVSNQSIPVEAAYYETGGMASAVVARGGIAFVANYSSGLHIVRNDLVGVVYPGDTDNNGLVDARDVLPLGLYFLSEGAIRDDATLRWWSQTMPAWDIAEAAYADADGNGVVDERDLFAVGINWGRGHATGTSAYEIDPDNCAVIADHVEAFATLYNSLSGDSEPVEAMRTLLAKMLGRNFGVLPSRFVVHQNVPNPFNPSTIIRFELPTAARVCLDLYDLSGKRVATVTDDCLYEAGEHSVEVAADKLGSGTYIYRLRAGNLSVAHKMTIVK